MSTCDNPGESAARSSIVAWLGVLFALVLLLIAVGGTVRLTQSGLSLPGWPFQVEEELGSDRFILIPPLSEEGWQELHHLYERDMARMEASRDEGYVGLGASGRRAESVSAFKTLFLIEWSHRFLAALVGIVGLGCLSVLLKRPALRRLAGGPLIAVVALVAVQSIIGGILVLTWTSTQMLFIHLGVATVILAIIQWTLLLLLQGHKQRVPPELRRSRRGTTMWVHSALFTIFVQIVLGALVAGSRHNGFATDWPQMAGEWLPPLWDSSASLSWNLLDNPMLHQWVHRWFAWVATVAVVGAVVHMRGAHFGLRGRLAGNLALALLLVQIVLGIMNINTGASFPVALTHLMMAMALFAALVLMAFDLIYEPVQARQAASASQRLEEQPA
ncbi:MAG: COX15/CtaA family protein [Planctomycetota bacterium]|jgi:cytochrome c oxidase assembly protein subunit 15